MLSEDWICTKCNRKSKYVELHHVMYRGIDWEHCPNCESIAIPTIGSTTSQPAFETDAEGCVHCDSGEEIPSAFNFCPYCGVRFRTA